MFQSIWEDARYEYLKGDVVTRLILINAVIFIGINILYVFLSLSNGLKPSPLTSSISHFFSVSSDWYHNLTHPWAIFTHMFLHESIWHFVWNMLYLFWFGRITSDFLGNERILPIYLVGGLAGFVAFYLSSSLIYPDANFYALGASAAVMAVVVAGASKVPDYQISLLFIGHVKLKYIAAVMLFLDLISIGNGDNTGGHFAHLGGALIGFLFVNRMNAGEDWSISINKWIKHIQLYVENIFDRKKPKVSYKNPKRSMRNKTPNHQSDASGMVDQEKINSILEKIKRSGYESLTDEDKDYLFRASKK